jgi:hypothetical protein
MDCQPLDDWDADVICLSIAYDQNNNGWHRADGGMNGINNQNMGG